MRWVILDGGEPQDRELVTLGDLVVAELADGSGEVTRLHLAKMKIGPCDGCFGCWVQRPGRCLRDDDAPRVSAELIASDAAVLLTRVAFGGYGWRVKQALDRSICMVSPLFTTAQGLSVHRRRYDRYPAFLGLGLVPKVDEQAAVFATLVERNARNLHARAHAAEVVVTGAPPAQRLRQVRSLIAVAETSGCA